MGVVGAAVAEESTGAGRRLENGIYYEVEPIYPDPMPDGLGVRKGSTRGSDLWVRRHRW